MLRLSIPVFLMLYAGCGKIGVLGMPSKICTKGRPLEDVDGNLVYCVSDDRGCPSGYECTIDALDQYPAPVCCRADKCSREEINECLESCLEKGLSAVPGQECTGCPCTNPCVAVLCIFGTVCEVVEVKCNKSPCPLGAQCIPICELPIEPGPCKGSFPRWGYDSEEGECEQFVYGGCEGNANNFGTKEACEALCEV